MKREEYRKHFNYACAYARRVGARREEQVEDFAHDYVLSIIEGREQSLGYAYVDYLRKNFGRTENSIQRKMLVGLTGCISFENPPIAPTVDPTDLIFLKQFKQYLKAYLRLLTDNERSVIEAILQGKQWPEVAKKLKISTSRCAQLKGSAFKKLALWLKEDGVY